MLSFEFDEVKSRANLLKHGIGFPEAQGLWDDPDALEIATRSLSEPRFLLIGSLDGTLWSAIFTYRGENIRLISVRRSRHREKLLYES